MFRQFTHRAKKVMDLAREEASRLNHDYIGTEHILLGLVAEGSGVAANVLTNLDVDIERVREEVGQMTKRGSDPTPTPELFTGRAKRTIDIALDEARDLEHQYVGTEHLLLALIRTDVSVATKVLIKLDTKLEDVREEVLELLGH